MNVLDRHTTWIALLGEEGSTLTVGYDNRGEPYREGVSFCLDVPYCHGSRYVFIDQREVKELKALLEKLFPDKTKAPEPNAIARERD